MKIRIGKNDYDIPSVPSVADYRYAKDLCCGCSSNESYFDLLSHLACNGIYESGNGQFICFTCEKCGEKIYFHIRDFEAYANLGVFDKYVAKFSDGLFEKPNDGVDSAFPPLNDKRISEVLSKCSVFGDSLWSEHIMSKDKERGNKAYCTKKIMDIFGHHFSGSTNLYGAIRLQYKKKKNNTDLLLKYKNIVTTEFKNICEFIEKAERGEYPQEVTLWDSDGYVTYTAVIVCGEAKLKRLVKRSDVKDEIKRVSDIAKRGGAFYYADMVKELKGLGDENPTITNHYLVTE